MSLSIERHHRAGKRPFEVVRKPRGAMGLDTNFPIDENVIAASVTTWLRAVLPAAHVEALPKADGCGVPRIIILLPGATIWMAVRTQNVGLPDEQVAFLAQLRRFGCKTAIVRGIEEARQAMERLGIETTEGPR